MFELFRHSEPEDMLECLEDLAVLADKDIAVITLNEEEYPVCLFAYARDHDLEVEADMLPEIEEEGLAELLGRVLRRTFDGGLFHGSGPAIAVGP